MAIVKARFVENGKKVVVIEPVSIWLDDIIERAVAIAHKRTDCDEFRMTLNDVELVFTNDITHQSLKDMYTNPIKHTKIIDSELYKDIEFNVDPLAKNNWSVNELTDLLDIQMEMALLSGDIEWAKQIHKEKTAIHSNNDKKCI